MTTFPASTFWEFSVGLYDRTGVAPACLGLQDRRGVDVNLVLYCCWLGAEGRPSLEAEGMRRTLAEIAPLQEEVIRPLRVVRRRMKQDLHPAPAALVDAIRRRLAAVERDAERLEQIELETTAAGIGVPEDAGWRRAAANLRTYAEAGGWAWDADDARDLAAVLTATFPEAADEAPAMVAAISGEEGAEKAPA